MGDHRAGKGSRSSATEAYGNAHNALRLVKEDHIESSPRKRKASTAAAAVTLKRKVQQACVYCRRSHMTCDEGRPCQRCVNRKIAHLCHDESTKTAHQQALPQHIPPVPQSPYTPQQSLPDGIAVSPQTPTSAAMLDPDTTTGTPSDWVDPPSGQQPTANGDGSEFWLGPALNFPPMFASEHVGDEFTVFNMLASLAHNEGLSPPNTIGSSGTSLPPGSSVLSDDDNTMNLGLTLANLNTPGLNGGMNGTASNNQDPYNATSAAATTTADNNITNNDSVDTLAHLSLELSSPTVNGILVKSKAEKFILTAADCMDDTRVQDRLTQYIAAKFEAGLLKPYNYVQGYARMSKWMEIHMSQPSRVRILNVLNAIRPSLRRVAQSVTDMDLVWAEEGFERHMLEYDRVFSAMGIPAALWRRTGEVFKANREFAALVGVELRQLKEGKVCIHELMTEQSAVNYWEKYGSIAFDLSQKAVLTSSTLRHPNPKSTRPPVNCCISFTIRRDRHGLPLMIVGNFLPTNPPFIQDGVL